MKEIINDNSEVTSNSEQIEVLNKNFPECFDKNGVFSLTKFSEILNQNETEITNEAYSLNWLGKSYARLLANEKPRTLLLEDKEHNRLLENKNSENILIKGDNLEVLKHLKYAYEGAIKMIYIDPPYNTGKDGFVYKDDRKFTEKELVESIGVNQEEAKNIISFLSSKASSHSAWLTFMFPRLHLAKRLLKDEGVIFISIDNNEVAQLKLLCDEVFGEVNEVGTIIWNNVTDNNPSNIATEHESILVYSKSKYHLEPVWKSSLSDIKNLLVKKGNELIEQYENQEELQKAYTAWFRENKFQLQELDRYKYIDEGGVYTGSQSVHNPGSEGYRYDVLHDITQMPCKQPLMGYRFPESKMNELLSDEKILFGKDHNKIIELKVYAHEFKDKLSSIFELDGRTGANQLRSLFPEMKKAFTNPKPTKLIEKLISFATDKNDLVLDFFVGSGTTGHSIFNLNRLNGLNNKFIAVQIDEKLNEKTEAAKNGYKTIFDITKERLIRSGKCEEGQNNLGFKIFQTKPLDENYLADIKELTPQTELFTGGELNEDLVNALLTTYKLVDGNNLLEPVKEIILTNYSAYLISNKLYLLTNGFCTENIKELVEKIDTDKNFSPSKIVIYGYNFVSKHQREIKEAFTTYANKKSIELDIVVRY